MSTLILLALAGMVFVGLADFFVKKGVNRGLDANALFFYTLIIAAVPFGILCFIYSIPIKMVSPLPEYFLALGAVLFAGTFFLLAALEKGDASIVVPIGRMGFVITAICAFIFIGEKLTITKGLGILFAILAIFLLSKK